MYKNVYKKYFFDYFKSLKIIRVKNKGRTASKSTLIGETSTSKDQNSQVISSEQMGSFNLWKLVKKLNYSKPKED